MSPTRSAARTERSSRASSRSATTTGHGDAGVGMSLGGRDGPMPPSSENRAVHRRGSRSAKRRILRILTRFPGLPDTRVRLPCDASRVATEVAGD